ncbi:hypothetical protein [Halorubellus sp. PRR65]|uniref:hypothetical protein n=1 Tax=Halorubellus sp. PRR65 TaxID=3098148 RepID=UPI002B256F2C|nr:hypothetical protein [Halorubellus sp. PRR65]
MRPITSLPTRPLGQQDIATLDEQGVRIAPYGGIPAGGEVDIYAVKMQTGGTAHALGFDDTQEQWRLLASTDASDLETADSQLDEVLDEWVQERYGGQFDVLKTV